MEKKHIVEFKAGHVINEGFQCLLLPMNSYFCIFENILSTHSEDEVYSIYRKGVQRDCAALAKKFVVRAPKAYIINNFLKYLNTLGFGYVNVKQMTQNSIVFSQDKVHLSTLYEMMFSQKPKVPVEVVTLCYLEGFCSHVFGREVKGKIVMKGRSLLFNLQLGKPVAKQMATQTYPALKANPLNRTLKHLVLNKHLDFTRGEFTLWNTYAVLLPYFMIADITDQLGDSFETFIKGLGCFQAKIAVDLQSKVFGVNDRDKLLLSLLEQVELVGMGQVEVLKLEKEHFEFKLYTNHEYFAKGLLGKDFLAIYVQAIIKGIVDFVTNITTEVKVKDNVFTLRKEKEGRVMNDEEQKIAKMYTLANLVRKTAKKG